VSPVLALNPYLYRRLSIALEAAMCAGYRAIDSAAVYRNHRQIAASLRRLLPQLGLTRQDIFLTSKLAPVDQVLNRQDHCLRSI
jgi:diketogulonate reductase-like aldo/keto reductase